MTAADDLFALLPRHLRARDTGLLAALLEAIAAEASVLDADVRQLYDDWFVETAAEWVLPYLGDLLGVEDLPDGPGRRAVVANTVEYRRRKGTAAVAEQVARDVVGAPARAVEHLRLLAASGHVNHVRLDRPAVADVRRAEELSAPTVASGALDPLMHTPEARRAPRGRGRYGIGNVWVHSFGTGLQQIAGADARTGTDGWWVHPLGVPTPLFAALVPEDAIEHLAGEAELPLPLRPRRLRRLLAEARAGLLAPADLPLRVTVDADAGPVEMGPDRLLVCGLEDLPAAPAGWHAFVDAISGHVALYRDGVRVRPVDAGAPRRVVVDHVVGGRPDVGAGPYDRADAHEAALVGDGYVPLAGDAVRAQVAVALASGDDPTPALAAPAEGGTSVVSFGDSGTWVGALAAEVPEASRLVLVAAAWGPRVLPSGALAPPLPGVYAPDGLRPVLRGTVTVTGRPGAALVLDGLVVDGDLEVLADGMTAVTVCQATITGTLRIAVGGAAGANRLTVRVLRSLVGGVDLVDTVPALEVVESIVSPEVADAPVAGVTVRAAGAHVAVRGATVRGDLTARTLAGTDALLDGTVLVAHRQVHCLRFSHVGPGSQTPRRFCEADAAPSYRSVRPGDPGFLALTAPGLLAASETGDEVGVDAHLRRTTLLAAARRLVAAHLPAGIDLFVRASR